jgi:6-phosphogluconate dehydrogenase
MQIAMIGLGKMGANMTERLLNTEHEVVAFDLQEEAVRAAESIGARGARTLEEAVNQLEPPRDVWVMVPSGDPTESTVEKLGELLEPDDIMIDGGNSYYKDSLRRYQQARAKGLHYLDVGVSGGIWGLKEGYGLMIGGDPGPVARLTPIFKSLAPAPDRGWGHMGPAGSGHYVKMVHNGIEYALMQAYAEGFALLSAKSEFDLDLHQVAEAWRFGTVIRSWLLDLTALALEGDASLESLAPWVDDSGEGRWTVQEAIDLAVPASTISEALFARFRSRRSDNFADKLLAAMRQQFGGHAVRNE